MYQNVLVYKLCWTCAPTGGPMELWLMMTPVLTLSPEAVEEDGVFRHPYLLRCDFALVADEDLLDRKSVV